MTVDCVIVGGGAVGASLALALAQLNYKVTLLEKNKPALPPEDFHARTLGLSYASHYIYDVLGIWDQLKNRAIPIQEVCVSVKGKFGSARLTHLDHQAPALGYVIGCSDLESALYQQLAKSENVHIYRGAEIAECFSYPDHWDLLITHNANSEKITCRLLVAADGTTSHLRQAQGIPTQKISYDHWAMISNVKIANFPKGVAVERFLKEGAIALLPWQQNFATCVWTIKSELKEALSALSPEEYMAECQKQLGQRFGTIVEMGQRGCLSLDMILAIRQSSPRFLLLGNAAHSLHPIAAQGLNLSLRDIWQLRKQALKYQPNFGDLGNSEFLKEYLAARKCDQARVVFATDKMARFMSGGPLPSWLRALGVTLFDCLHPIKNKFTRYSMGLM
ncbi:MAG: FAD-dependent oxidoreductase [Candidatus Berkiellales bacterium]